MLWKAMGQGCKIADRKSVEEGQRKDERGDEFNAECEHEGLRRKKSARRPDLRMNLLIRMNSTRGHFKQPR